MLRLRRYERILIENRRFCKNWHKILGKGVVPTNHFSCHKTRINVLSYGIRMWAQVSFVLSQCTRLTDGRTDERTDRKALQYSALHYPTCVARTMSYYAYSVVSRHSAHRHPNQFSCLISTQNVQATASASSSSSSSSAAAAAASC